MKIGMFLWQRRYALMLLGVCSAVFLAVFALYGLPLRAVMYPAALCAGILLVVGIADYIRWRHKHGILCALDALPEGIGDALPKPASAVEADYQQLLRRMEDVRRQEQLDAQRRYQDMMDYYTVWAHQIKTPIAAMRLHLQQEDSALSRTLTTEVMRVEQYADMVLAYLRLDGDSTDYVIRECDLDDLVRQAVKRFAGEFIARHLTLDYQPLQTKAVTDEKWLGFVVEQLLSNALKYTRTGSVTISMEQPKVLCIRDTGIGIAPEDLPRIFEHGYTGGTGRSERRASGIGLYLCKRICRNLGHKISAESAPGKGTAIRIDLNQYELKAE